ncbi:hypothetical protein CEXT_2951 [Caerostris extrusa]|uniref:Uncharacterized protein n=1 Tax=Caerostris extrusa TaxID=172846 RepID=A0AAV4MJI0_CAEEX|nr:hypothetical protein CEXT_2951 [Caerostris extrusa]
MSIYCCRRLLTKFSLLINHERPGRDELVEIAYCSHRLATPGQYVKRKRPGVNGDVTAVLSSDETCRVSLRGFFFFSLSLLNGKVSIKLEGKGFCVECRDKSLKENLCDVAVCAVYYERNLYLWKVNFQISVEKKSSYDKCLHQDITST